MAHKLDLEEMEAAFRRAAHRALHGTREERSGRFLPKKPANSSENFGNDSPAARRDREPAGRWRG